MFRLRLPPSLRLCQTEIYHDLTVGGPRLCANLRADLHPSDHVHLSNRGVLVLRNVHMGVLAACPVIEE